MATATNRPAPSFAVTALQLLQSNSIIEAAQLCASGVEHYPDYIGGYILLASAYESLGQHHDAQVIREALHTRFPGLPLLKSYVQAPSEVPVETEQIVVQDDSEELQTDVAAEDWILDIVEIEDDVERHIDAEAVQEHAEELAEVNLAEQIEEPAEADAEQFIEEVIDLQIEQEVSQESSEELIEQVENPSSIHPTPEDDLSEPELEEIFFEVVEPEVVPSASDESLHEHSVDVAFHSHPNVLRLIEMAPVSTDTRVIRSASVRLIPGLEYTTLRFEGTRSRGRREITALLDPPAFRTFHQMRRMARPSETPEPRKKPVTLEELAARLTDARMPKSVSHEQEISKVDFSAQQSPIMVTETIARIYMQQGSYELAIEAFKNLQKNKPEKHDEFEKLIKECERKRT